MKNTVKILLIAIIVIMVSTISVYGQFSDISGHWAKADNENWVSHGKISGYSDGTFKPNNPVTRAEFAKMLFSSIDIEDNDSKVTFNDLKATDWFYEPVMRLAKAGYISGYTDGGFRPQSYISRQDAAVMMGRIFSDRFFSEEDILSGFTDGNSVASYSKPFISGMIKEKIISGYTDNTIRPKANITRAEAVVLIDRVVALMFPEPTPEPIHDEGFDEALYNSVAENNRSIKADNFAKGYGVIAWWDNYARFAEGSVSDIQGINADTDHTGYRNDEGRGPYARQIDALTGVPKLNELHANGLKGGAWIECQGDSRVFLMAVHQLDDGTFEMDSRTKAAKLMAWVWGWSSLGPDKNKNANYLCWTGVHSFVNNEEWAYPYVLANYKDVISAPAYPDGKPAVGYLSGGGRTTPHFAKIYDACGAKDLNGNIIRYGELGLTSGDKKYALKLTDKDGKEYFTDDFAIGKDSSAPFWLEYSKNSIDFWVKNGADFFWIDNWNGWDNINNNPLIKAFGNWSDFKFREYLKERPELSIKNPESLSISAYVKAKALELEPGCDPSDLKKSQTIYQRSEWIDDPVWMAYLAFKSQENLAYNKAIFTAVKEASEKYNGDRDAVGVMVNDFPYMSFGAYDGDYIDLVSTEYNNDFSAATGFSTTGYPPNRYSGHNFALISDTARSHTANVWYYDSVYPDTDTMGKVFGYEALAYNVTLHSAFSGTKASSKDVNGSIGKLRDIFSDRTLYSDIGVMYSSETELSLLAPGGFITGEKHTHDLAYMGWCHMFDELNVPYKSIQEGKLADRIGLLNILILPNVRSISKNTIDNVLLPFLNDGGTVVITGSDAGCVDSIANSFKKHNEPLLVKLANDYKGNGKVIYINEDPMVDYMIFNKKSDIETMYDYFITDAKAMVEGWYNDGFAEKLLTLENIQDTESIISTLNYSPTGKTFFIDLVNMKYNPETDTLSKMPSAVKVNARIPETLWGYEITVSLYTDDSTKVVKLTEGKDYTIEGAHITVTIPQFLTYATIIIDR